MIFIYKTIEAIYNEGQIIPINEPINIKKAKVLLIVMEEDHEEEINEDYIRLQIESNAYKEWIGPENNIYDELFKYEIG